MLSTKNPLKYKDELKSKEVEKIYHVNTNYKKSAMDIFISDKVNFKASNITRYKEDHYIMIKGPVNH